MVFRYVLKINDFEFPRYSNVKIMQNADGYGTSGVCMSEMTFNIPASDYGFQEIPPSAKVTFHMVGAGDTLLTIAPTFYIYSRSKNGAVISFKCYDRMIWTEQTDTISEATFNAFAENGLVESQWIVQQIASQCGFNGWGLGGTATYVPEVYLPAEDVIRKNCHDILNSISEAWCGFFKVDNDNKLVFIPFGSTYSLDNTADKHTSVSMGGVKGPIMRVVMSNGSETFFAGNSGADVFNVLKISSKYASGDIAAQIMERVEDYVYEAWECKKCIIGNDNGGIEINAAIAFADGSERIANHITKIPTAAGIFISCGSNDVTETEFDYLGVLSRKINNKIGDGEKLGNNTVITRYQGIVHLAEEKAKTRSGGSAASVKQFGYSKANSDGTVIFDGDMVSAGIFESAEKIDDNTVIVTYPDFKIKYTKTGDGSKATLKKEIIREGDENG